MMAGTTTQTHDRATESRSTGDEESAMTTRTAELRGALRTAGAGVGDAVDAARTAVPELARTSQELADGVMRRIQAGSDQQVSAGVAMSLGLAIGMLLGGAPRILIAAALAPLAAMAFVLMDRRYPRTSSTAAGRGA
jgi:hypothetical protein